MAPHYRPDGCLSLADPRTGCPRDARIHRRRRVPRLVRALPEQDGASAGQRRGLVRPPGPPHSVRELAGLRAWAQNLPGQRRRDGLALGTGHRVRADPGWTGPGTRLPPAGAQQRGGRGGPGGSRRQAHRVPGFQGGSPRRARRGRRGGLPVPPEPDRGGLEEPGLRLGGPRSGPQKGCPGWMPAGCARPGSWSCVSASTGS